MHVLLSFLAAPLLTMSLAFPNSILRPVVLAAGAVVVFACGDAPSGTSAPSEIARLNQETSGVDNTLDFLIRDTVVNVGDVTYLSLRDSAVVSMTRRRFLAPTVEWWSGDTTVATVFPNGVVVAKGEGEVEIHGEMGDATGVQTLRVLPPPPPPNVPDDENDGNNGNGGGDPDPTLPADSPAELPRSYVTLPTAEGTGTVRRVGAGQSIQAALNAAKPGDVILLQQGAVFSEALYLRKKTGEGIITIRTDMESTPVGRRVAYSDTLRFARLQSPGGNTTTLRADPGAANYWIVNVHVTLNPSQNSLNTILTVGDGSNSQNTMAKVPSNIYLDRVIVRGRPNAGVSRCVGMHGKNVAVVHSIITECHGKGFDSQGIASWNGPGPFLIENNLIEGAGQNIMFGGAHPGIVGLNPSDIVIRWNHINKPPIWYSSKQWTIKNHVQFKHAQRVLMQHNLIENVWTDAQTGSSIAMSSTNQQGGRTTWAESADITFVDNVIRRAGRGMTISAVGSNNKGTGVPMSRLLVSRNVLYELGSGSPYGGGGEPFRLLNGVRRIHITENTTDGSNHAIHLASDGNPPKVPDLVYARNVASFGKYGVFGGGHGIQSIKSRYTSYVFVDNCFFNLPDSQNRSSTYPLPNRLTDASALVTMPGLNSGNVAVAGGSACKQIAVPDGNRLGADASLVSLLESRAITGLGAP